MIIHPPQVRGTGEVNPLRANEALLRVRAVTGPGHDQLHGDLPVEAGKRQFTVARNVVDVLPAPV